MADTKNKDAADKSVSDASKDAFFRDNFKATAADKKDAVSEKNSDVRAKNLDRDFNSEGTVEDDVEAQEADDAAAEQEIVDSRVYERGHHPAPRPITLYPSPNIEVEVQNILAGERAKEEEISIAKGIAAAVTARKAATRSEAKLQQKLDEARAKVEADFAKEETRLRVEATKRKDAVRAKAGKGKAEDEPVTTGGLSYTTSVVPAVPSTSIGQSSREKLGVTNPSGLASGEALEDKGK